MSPAEEAEAKLENRARIPHLKEDKKGRNGNGVKGVKSKRENRSDSGKKHVESKECLVFANR